jgi:Zinc finger, C2H2 type/Zinc-finger of C2H2 type
VAPFSIIFFNTTTRLFADDPLTPPVTSWIPRRSMKTNNSNPRNNEGRYFCTLCDKSFRYQQSCIDHYEVHSGTTTCGICDKVLANKQVLANHMAKHLGKIQCVTCKRTFSSNSALNRHRRFTNCGEISDFNEISFLGFFPKQEGT